MPDEVLNVPAFTQVAIVIVESEQVSGLVLGGLFRGDLVSIRGLNAEKPLNFEN